MGEGISASQCALQQILLRRSKRPPIPIVTRHSAPCTVQFVQHSPPISFPLLQLVPHALHVYDVVVAWSVVWLLSQGTNRCRRLGTAKDSVASNRRNALLRNQ